jgi:hypothetical protein
MGDKIFKRPKGVKIKPIIQNLPAVKNSLSIWIELFSLVQEIFQTCNLQTVFNQIASEWSEKFLLMV